jgi:hypothetical protein
MSPEKDAELCKKYPKIFRDRHESMQNTLMCWGFECADGWFDLIDTLCSDIQNHVDWAIKLQRSALDRGEIKEEDLIPEEDMQVVAAQVKEKYGGLRFYVNGADDTVSGMITMAESMSYRLCEECGKPGRPNNDGWVRTQCEDCRSTFDQRRIETWKKEEK